MGLVPLLKSMPDTKAFFYHIRVDGKRCSAHAGTESGFGSTDPNDHSLCFAPGKDRFSPGSGQSTLFEARFRPQQHKARDIPSYIHSG